ncbi:MAG: glycosyltransferase family 4 protein [Plectolyngbya sp. WJT66-NPBG17]|jgi:glycosyltransferase involved in cell wall biosynthesis|nr:glycosyltransferase family 4 protein [Plectolyngbya sp. WJT66-NPBG17]MBW4526552.1 glycosyltransferase family 4 protein [Phormidium tanganyikae FI6-MK23]
MFNFGFVVEQMLGHVTHYQNLRQWVKQDPSVCPTWLPIEANQNDLWEHLPIVRTNWSLKSSLRARDAIRSSLHVQALDGLFLHTQTVALFASSLMQQIPTIISTDATPLNYDSVGAGYEHKVGGNALLDRQKFLWNRNSYHAATALVAFCQWIKDSLITDYGVPADKVIVIPPGVDLEQWQFRLDRPTHHPVRLLFVGGDFVRKGGHTLIEAFRTIGSDCTLDIVTKDAKVAEKLSGIEGVQVYQNLAANSPELKELYAAADIFVFPSQADCYPNVLMEAMASGLPVIATDVGAIREQVETGVNGLLLPSSDAGTLVTALRMLIGDESKRRMMSIASRRLAEERFNGQTNYNKVLTLMKDLAEERRALKRLPSQTTIDKVVRR